MTGRGCEPPHCGSACLRFSRPPVHDRVLAKRRPARKGRVGDMTRETWSIRPYRSGDEISLVELFARVFKKPIGAAHWLWKLRGYQLPFENVWLAVNGERVIAQYAGIPIRVQTTGGIRWAVQSVDTMVDPDYRRRGLFAATAKHAFAHWAEAGVAFVYGLPNEHSRPGFEQLGLKCAFPLQWRQGYVRPFSALARRTNFNFPTRLLDTLWQASLHLSRQSTKNVQLVEVFDVGADFDQISRRMPLVDGFAFVRDREWVRWRYLQAPQLGYRLMLAREGQEPLGYAAYRLHGPAGIIAEVIAPRDHISVVIMRGAIERLITLGAESVRTLAVPETSYDRHCRSLHLATRQSFDVAFLPLSVDISREHISNPNAWHMSGGDFDVA